MSYAMSAALQTAVYETLMLDPALDQLVGPDIYDAFPTGVLPALYVALGPERVKDRSDKTGAGAAHEFTISVITDTAGFASAKQTAAAVCDALLGADFVLARGHVTALNFLRAKAARIGTGNGRRIDLTFMALLHDS